MMTPWLEKNNQIEKEFHFANFQEALAFVHQVGALAEEANHHPDIFLHDYKHVRISLTTHSAGKVTDKDHILAEKLDRIM